jgi:hypothetical protein
MDPQNDNYYLTMDELVDRYAACGADSARATMWLINLYWRGAFEPYARVSQRPMTARKELLTVWRATDHPRIVFESEHRAQEVCDDGSIIVDLRQSITLPQQPEAWTRERCEDAYRIACAKLALQLAREDAGKYQTVNQLSKDAVALVAAAFKARAAIESGKNPAEHYAAARAID